MNFNEHNILEVYEVS